MKALREYSEGHFAAIKEGRADLNLLKSIIEDRIQTGRWRHWRCQIPNCSCGGRQFK